MRVNNSRFHCPSYCFSKPLSSPRPPPPDPPPSPLQTPSPVQCQPHSLETKDSDYHTSSEVVPGPLVIEEKLCDEKVEIGENGDGRKGEFVLKSSLKKTSSSASKDVVRECVKWMDDLGEELVEIREFEPIESGELDDAMNGYSTCTCVIL